MRLKTYLSIVLATLLLLSQTANAANFSFSGTFSKDDDVQLFKFSLDEPTTIKIQTFSYDGGFQSDDTYVNSGGFDPVIALFNGKGELILQQDDGVSSDVLLEAHLKAGNYIISLMQFENFANGSTLDDGFARKGETDYTGFEFGPDPGMFYDLYGNSRGNYWNVDILKVSEANVEEVEMLRGILSSVIVDHNWHHVNNRSLSEHTVIITAPPSYNGPQPGVIRVNKRDTGGFDLRFQEWDYLDGQHKNEVVPYLVLEQGRYTLSDGSTWEVGTFDLAKVANLIKNAQWTSHAFSQTFTDGIPQLFLTVQTAHGNQTISVRAKNVTGTGFEAALFEQELFMNSGHNKENIGYLAIYSPTGSGNVDLGTEMFPYHLQQSKISHHWLPVLANTLKVEEEQSLDNEIGHVSEIIDVLILGTYLFAQDVSSWGGDSAALRQN